MAWKGRYYYRNRRVGKQIVTEYVGGGIAGYAAERLSELAREKAEQKRREWEAIKDEQERLDTMVNDFGQLAATFADAVLLLNGYRQHKRGEWRKKRNG